MSTAGPRSLSVDRSAGGVGSRLADYLELTKPRIVVLELIVATVAACTAAPRGLDVAVVLHALAATACIAASASVANQWVERRSDRTMRRTAERPLASGRVRAWEACALSAVGLFIGLIWLCVYVNGVTALLGAASWLIYVAVYTPLKSRTPLNTAVGAVAGAIPLLMGWTATGAPLGLKALSLACVLFLWQFPHFMAIAWIYRRDYAAAGSRMLTVVDPSGARAGVQAVTGAALMIPVSLIPALLPSGGSPMLYASWSIILGAVFLGFSTWFALERSDASARMLLKASLIYLPAWLGLTVMVNA